MTVATLLDELQRKGVKLRLEGSRLRFWPKSAVAGKTLDNLRKHKNEITTLLKMKPKQSARELWDGQRAHQIISQTIETINDYHAPRSFDSDAFHAFDKNLNEAFEQKSLQLAREACQKYSDATGANAAWPQTDIITVCHGIEVILAASKQRAIDYGKNGRFALHPAETKKLVAAAQGKPLPAEAIRNLALIKRQFPEAEIESFRDWSSRTNSQGDLALARGKEPHGAS